MVELDKQKFNPFEETLRQLEFKSVLEYIAKFCKTADARELILSSKPNDNISNLRCEHNLIAEALTLLFRNENPPLENIGDSRNLLLKSQIQNAILLPSELLEIIDLMRVARNLKSFIKPKEDEFPHLFNLLENLYDNKLLEKHILDIVDETGNIKDSASRELFRIRNEINVKSARLRSQINKIVRQFSDVEMLQEEFFTIREGRFVIPVKVEHKRQISGIIHGVSQTGATVFLEPTQIIELNNDLSLLRDEEMREIQRILQQITQEIGSESTQLLQNAEIIAHIDAIFAKAQYALKFGGQKPEILDQNDNYIYLKNIRHPILVQSKGVKSVVPLSIEFTDKQRGHLVSGPNAGGKTVALKNIGLNILLALSGIFPLGECKTNYRTVFSTIGDNQSIENDLSTFSSQMFQIKSILDACDNYSLVLIDEIGSGTDPQEGAALAAGILDTFIELNLFFVATTHQSSLKTYALNKEVIANASLEFDEEKFKPTYIFLTGIPGNSYAFSLVENIGLPKIVINRARKYLGERHSELEQSIAILQKYRAEAVRSRSEAEALKAKLEKMIKDYDARSKELKIKRKEILDKAKTEALSILDNANALVENTIRQIKEQNRSISEIKQEYKAQKQTLEKEVKKIELNEQKSVKSTPVTLSVGQSVAHCDNPTNVGIVLECNDEEKIALVEINGLKFKLPYTKLIIADPKESKSSVPIDYIKYDAVTKIDLRGMRADEALRTLDEFIDDALLNNVDYVTILHGKGTGALKQTIHDFLSRHPSIASFRLGELVEGGAGVTIVKFKE